MCSALGFSGATVDRTYAEGFTLKIPQDFFDLRGHDLEARVTATWAQIGGHVHRGLLGRVVLRTVPDHPGFVPQSLLDLFARVLADDV